jgi:molybdate transport system substrate-binding protein
MLRYPKKSIVVLLSFIASLLIPTLAWAGSITVSAAISLKEALTEISQNYQKETGTQVNLNFAASGTLAAQIKQGAPVDLFVSAGAHEVDDLIATGVANGASRTDVVGNSLVLVVPASSTNPPKSFADLADKRFTKIAGGQPKVVPAGDYAAQVLKKLNLEAAVADRLVTGDNVRQVLQYVIRGEADAGIVYATDAQAAGNSVKVAVVADESTHDPIRYPAVTIKTGQQAEAMKFLEYLKTDKSKAVWVAHGFQIPTATTQPATMPG